MKKAIFLKILKLSRQFLEKPFQAPKIIFKSPQGDWPEDVVIWAPFERSHF